MGLTIREARRDDLPAIVALLAKDDIGGSVDTPDPGAMPAYTAQFDAIAASETEALYVAEIEDTVVGTFQIVIARSLPYRARTRCILEAVQVDPNRRGRRIGAAMVDRALAEARTRGADVMTLSSNLARTQAHRFYERLGFEKTHAGFKMAL